MNFETCLKENGIIYKKLDEDEWFSLFKVREKVIILYQSQVGSDFIMERDIFEYIDGNRLPYLILLEDLSKNNLFLLSFNSKNNWVKSSFDSCDKIRLHLGKRVLNSTVDLNQIIKKLKII